MRVWLFAAMFAVVLALGCGPTKPKEQNDPQGNPMTPPEIMIEEPMEEPMPEPMDQPAPQPPAEPGPAPSPNPEPAETPAPPELNPPAQPAPPAADPGTEPKPESAGLDGLLPKLSDPAARDAALAAIKGQGAAAVEPLVAALASANADLQANAALALGALGKEAQVAVPELKKLAESTTVPADLRDTAKFAIDAIEGR